MTKTALKKQPHPRQAAAATKKAPDGELGELCTVRGIAKKCRDHHKGEEPKYLVRFWDGSADKWIKLSAIKHTGFV